MNTIALPSDSASSVALLRHLVSKRNLQPKYVEMGPDLEGMLDSCDGCLLIGDRALEGARAHPDLVVMDLGSEWLQVTGNPMVFGVFAARRDSDVELIKSAYDALISRLEAFENDDSVRSQVIAASGVKSAQSVERLERYFGEVINRMDSEDMDGLRLFLKTACGMNDEPVMAW